MNGRVYDPVLGRFLSVDPMFQFPTNMQSLNPYSYVLNNPLSMTDPTGYVSSACDHGNGRCAYSITIDQGSGGGIGSGGARDAKGNSIEVKLDKLSVLTGVDFYSISAAYNIGGGKLLVVGGRSGADNWQGLYETGAGAKTSASGATGADDNKAPQVADVFKHYNANDDLTYSLSPFDMKSIDILQGYLDSPVGKVVGAYAIASQSMIGVAEMATNSKYPPEFSTDAADRITYSLDAAGIVSRMPAKEAKQFIGIRGDTLLTDLIAHEVAHTMVGSTALGKPYSVDDSFKEESNAVRYGENPYREYMHLRLRDEYGGKPIEPPLVVQPQE